MYCEGSARQAGRRQAVMVFNAASLRDFAAFSLLSFARRSPFRPPSFHSVCFAVDDR
jgi:hypothetical protein